MLFTEPPRSSWDWNFSLFGVPVRVHPFFWLMSLLMGWGALAQGIQFLLLWVAAVFVSILVHEFGHVVVGRVFGAWSHIVLYGLGGLAVGSNALNSRWKRIAVCFGGPFAGFLLLGVTVLCYLFLPSPYQAHPLVQEALSDLWFINLFWGLMNLLPIYPLDGGQISVDFLGWLMPRNGTRAALAISLFLSGLLAVNSLARLAGFALVPYVPAGGWWFAILFGSLALGSFQALQREQERARWIDERDMTPWERQERRWEREDDADYWPQDRGRWEK
ncbi:MAG TPA: site-2 protease family protein [Gemmataceae bacterium]|nr:site-2 protease family protein [Gemmataceae bacterium]